VADIREMLARLNPANIKFDIGRGGVPDLTPQDIAAALAFVPAGLGREVFARLWWPDGARLSPHELDRQISNLVHAEALRRHNRYFEARSRLLQHEEMLHRLRHVRDDQRQELNRLAGAAEDAKRELWPHRPEMHVVIREAVLDEIAHPALCATCEGHGTVMDDNLMVVCPACQGVRIVPMSDRARAARIGRDESSYRASWKLLYEWLLVRIRDAEAQAAAQFRAALRRDDEAA